MTTEVLPGERGPGPGRGPAALPALVAVLDDLVEAGVPHCSWKSNEHLDAALAGDTDLDLLVDREWAGTFRSVMTRHGLKLLVPPPGAAFPAMEHHLGFDPESGRLFHLHVHYQLVLGERFVKNHRLPIEREMLDRTRLVSGVQAPAPELELAVLVVRVLLKYRIRDFVKDQLAIRTPGIPAPMMREIDWLLPQTDVAAVRDVLGENEVVPAEIVCRFLDTIDGRSRPGFARLRLRTQTRAALGRHARVSRPRAVLAYSVAVWQHRRRQRRGTAAPRMTMATGGASFALVGADGSGKSTVAAELSSWLGWKVDARVHYLGSKPPSRASRWTYLAFRASRRGVRAASESFGEGTLVVRAAAGTRDTALAAHHLATARQRAHEYAAASRDTADGRVVVFDRFPLTRVAEIPRHDLVDGPRIAATVDSPGGPVMRRLAAAEQRIYQGFRPPTAMVVLDVDPEVATARKPDHDHDTVAAKARVLSFVSRTLAVPGSRVRTVDADRPLDDVLHDVKTELWHAL